MLLLYFYSNKKWEGPAKIKWVQYCIQLNVWDLNHLVKWDQILFKFLAILHSDLELN
jgi:hypothetical protein